MTHPQSAVQQFIEDTIKGGLKLEAEHVLERDEYTFAVTKYDEHVFLLDPKAWEAVGKTRNWNSELVTYKLPEREVHTIYKTFKRPASVATRKRYRKNKNVWKIKMHRFIDHLADGDDIETALSKIT